MVSSKASFPGASTRALKKTVYPHTPTIPLAFRQWLEDAGDRPQTIKSYLYKVKAFQLWQAGRPFTSALIREYADHTRIERRLRPRTLHVIHSALRAWGRWQKEVGLLSDLPDFRPLRPGRLDDPIQVYATEDDVEAMWQAARGMPEHTPYDEWRKYRTLMTLAISSFTGLRRSEILMINLRDFRCETQGDRYRLFLPDPKGGDPRWMHVHEELQEILERWVPIREGRYDEVGGDPDALIPYRGSTRLGNNGLTEIYRDLAKRAGVTRRITAHAFRRWMASRIAKKDGLPVAQRTLGHSDPRTTLAYIRTTVEEVEQAIDGLPVMGKSAAAPIARGSATPHPSSLPSTAPWNEAWRGVV